MSFINFAMLFGAAAVSIPLIIHLLNRSRFRTVQWGAMHLLRNVVVVNSRRIKLERLLLLLVRCAIPLLLALMMARPVLTGWRALSGDVPSSTIVVLDDSYSMEAGAGGRSAFDAAVDETARIIGNLKRGSDVSVLLMGGAIEPLLDRPSFDAAAVVKQVRALKPGHAAAEPVQGFDAAVSLLRSVKHARREILIVSDFQKVGWSSVDSAQRARLAELLKAADVPAHLTFFCVGGGAANPANIAVESLELSRQTLGVNQTLQARAVLRNYGTSRRDNVRVYFRVDAAEKSASQISLDPGEQGQLLFTTKFDAAGSHLVQVEADAVDLKSDNTLTAAVNVIDRIPVLILNGAPSTQLLQNETDFLEIALQPFASARGPQLSDLIESRTVDAAKFRPEMLENVKAVVLANVSKLDAAARDAVLRYVRAGGGLVVFPGDKLDVNAWNDLAALMPGRIETRTGHADDSTKHSAILLQRFEHPAVSMFNDGGGLSDASIREWYRIAPDPAATVLMRLEAGDPLLLERKVGDGVVIASATAADADWSNLPLRPFYLPLMQQIVSYAATRVDPPRNVETGRPLLIMLPRSDAGAAVTLVDADGVKHTLKPVEKSGRAVAEFAHTRRPGVYTLTDPRRQPVHFSVTAPRHESQLESLSDEQLRDLAAALNASVVHSGAEYAAVDRTRRHGTELWKPLLAALAFMLFAEMLMQQRFSSGRSA